jgi:hypothetical protein
MHNGYHRGNLGYYHLAESPAPPLRGVPTNTHMDP